MQATTHTYSSDSGWPEWHIERRSSGPHTRWAILAVLMAILPARADTPSPSKPDDLGERLIHKATTGQQEREMDAILRIMDDTAARLSVDFDPGESTQALQADIAAKLDQLIAEAAKRQHAASTVKRAQQGDKRQAPSDRKNNKDKRSKPQEPVADSEPRKGSVQARQPTGTPADGPNIGDARRAWGHLPKRDRDELTQGLQEESLQRYQAWVEAYFRALQETADEH